MKKFLFLVALASVILGFRFWMVKNIEFTDVEHMTVFRSWSISKYGLDEFGRHSPLLFGSTNGVQAPALTYLTTPYTFLFGSNASTEYVLDQIFFLIPFLAALALGYDIYFAILMTTNPVFFWPGNWEAKLLTVCLLGIWKTITSTNMNLLLLVALSIFSLSVSFDAWFTVPLIILIGFFYRKQKYKQVRKGILGTVITCVVVTAIITLLNKDISNHLKFNYLNFNQDIGITNTIDSFRGEDIKSGLGFVGKILHNKLQFISVLMGQSMSYLSPSFLFATGDKDAFSNSMWVPPFLSLYFFLLILSLISKHDNEDRFLFIWILATVFLMGFVKFPQTEQRIYLVAIPLVLLLAKQINKIPKRFLNLVCVLIIFNLFCLGILSGSVNSTYQERCSLELIKSFANTADKHIGNRVSISDDICSNPGPGISMLMSIKPKVSEDISYFGRYLRSIGNVEIISPKDIVKSSNPDIRILSKNMADSFPNYISKNTIVKKQIIFSGDNNNFSMYLITVNEK